MVAGLIGVVIAGNVVLARASVFPVPGVTVVAFALARPIGPHKTAEALAAVATFAMYPIQPPAFALGPRVAANRDVPASGRLYERTCGPSNRSQTTSPSGGRVRRVRMVIVMLCAPAALVLSRRLPCPRTRTRSAASSTRGTRGLARSSGRTLYRPASSSPFCADDRQMRVASGPGGWPASSRRSWTSDRYRP